MGQRVLLGASFPSERLTELPGSRHSLSRCWGCFTLLCFSSLDPPGALGVRGGPKKLLKVASVVIPTAPGSGHCSSLPWEPFWSTWGERGPKKLLSPACVTIPALGAPMSSASLSQC